MIKYYTRKFFIPALGHVYGLSDQILLSAGSFITIIILARWSTSEIVGLVAIALNVSTFFLLIHKGISTTFTVIVSSNDLEKQKSYLREFILIHLPLFATLVVCLFLLPPVIWQANNSKIMLVNMIILLITTSLMYEAERRILWAFEMDKNALKLSILRLATLILFLVIMKAVNLGFTLTLAFVWIISARLISIPTYLQRWNFTKRAKTRPVSIFIKAYWKFSKWIFFRDFLSYLAGNIYVPMVFFMLGAAKTGGFEVGRQLIAPFYIIPMGLNSYLLPKLTKDKGKMSNKQYEHYVLKLMVAWISLFATASILLISFGNNILSILIGNYASFNVIGNGIYVLALLGFAISINLFSELVIYSIERPDLGWKPMAISALLNGIIGVPLVVKYGIIGAFAGNAITSILSSGLIMKSALVSLKPDV